MKGLRETNNELLAKMTKRFLCGRDVEAALDLLKERGITQGQLCELLECSPHNARRWKASGAPRYIALALTALLDGRPPWKPTKAMVEAIKEKDRERIKQLHARIK